MSKLYRPTIPVEVKCRVALRQLGEMFIDDVIRSNRFTPRVTPPRSLAMLLNNTLAALAELLKCEVKELRLDHDPALGLRQQIAEGQNMRLRYLPDANDPEFLCYRPHGAQHAGSHDVKTRIRGDHGQYSDITLIKRQRRRDRRACKEPAKKARGLSLTKQKTKWPKRSFPKRKKR